VDFAEGLSATIDWYRANTSWWQAAKDETEAKYAKSGQ
jgi:dTDP-glucose 4,6-dehydratase